MAADHHAALSLDEARRVYDRIGRVQDWQAVYEKAPVADLIEHGGFGEATAVYELGCGTGAFAERLLTAHLPPGADYLATDISPKMVRLATKRLAPWTGRCTVELVDGTLPLRGDDHAFDRFVASYVFDLLDGEYAAAVVDEAARLLAPGGTLCAVSLADGATRTGRVVSRGWDWLFAHAPKLVGGCRPIELAALLGGRWHIEHRRLVTSWGVPSEVIVAGRP